MRNEKGVITVATLAWESDHAAPSPEDATAQLHARVFLDGVELERALGVTVEAQGGDFLQASIHYAPARVETVWLSREDFDRAPELIRTRFLENGAGDVLAAAPAAEEGEQR